MIFWGDKTLGTSDIQEYVNVLSDMSVSKAIIVVPTQGCIAVRTNLVSTLYFLVTWTALDSYKL